MARENQGLQIALIIFVTLTVGLGASTYWVYRLYDEQSHNAKAAAEEAKKGNDLANKNANDVSELKKIIGAAATDSIETVLKTSDNDMKTYGSAYAEGDRVYHRLLEKMFKTIKDTNASLAAAKAEVPKLEDEYKNRVAAQDLQVKQFQESATKASQDLAGEQSKFRNDRTNFTHEEEELENAKKAAIKEKADLSANLDRIKQDLEQHIKRLQDNNQEIKDKLEKLTQGKIDSFNGEISWVNQREQMVWINLGRADALSRQVTFAVFAAGSTDMKQSKAGIEVTRILGDHLAEARILDDSVSNPIIPGDKIFTPLWSPGEERHFALAGLMDIDGSGHSNLDVVMSLIKSAGGAVDCYIADSGRDKNKIRGAVTINTNCLIVGAAPDEKGDPAQRDAFTKIVREADQFRLPKIQLGDFLQRIGWKNMSPMVRYGRGANPNDFRAKPSEGVVHKSTGNTSDVFKEREPPATNTGRYYKF